MKSIKRIFLLATVLGFLNLDAAEKNQKSLNDSVKNTLKRSDRVGGKKGLLGEILRLGDVKYRKIKNN